MGEYREAVRNDPARSDAALRLAQIHFERAEYRAAVDFIETHIKSRPFNGPAPFILAARARTATDSHEDAQKVLQELLRHPGHEVVALVELASAARAALGAEAAVDALEQAGAAYPEVLADPELERALVGLLFEAGRGDDALARARKRASDSPNDALAHDLVGRVLLRQSRVAEAAAEFERAVELDADAAAPRAGLGFIAMARGEFATAFEHFDTAAKLDPSTGEYPYRAAQARLAAGDREAAMAKLHTAIEVEPAHAAACNDLAWMLAETGGDLELALQLARRALRVSPSAATRDTLGWVHLKRGDGDLAEQAFAQVIAAEGETPSLLYHLGLALAAQGKTSDAIDALRRAVEGDAFPEADAAVAELARLEQP
jgi:tetratricopeptide (TPR) repeat protein